MFRFTRRAAVAALASLGLAACGGGDTGGASTLANVDGAALNDIIIGSADAPITMVEYASWTCPACEQFHRDVMGVLKSEYVETGKVRFVFREFPTQPRDVTIAGFRVARCAGEDKYYDVLDDLFARQPAILSLVRTGGPVRDALKQIAATHGIEGEDAFSACLNDQTILRSIAASINLGENQGVQSTPTIFMNGKQLPGSNWRLAAGMREVLDAELERLGVSETPAEDAPVEETVDTDADTDPSEPAEADTETATE